MASPVFCHRIAAEEVPESSQSVLEENVFSISCAARSSVLENKCPYAFRVIEGELTMTRPKRSSSLHRFWKFVIASASVGFVAVLAIAAVPTPTAPDDKAPSPETAQASAQPIPAPSKGCSFKGKIAIFRVSGHGAVDAYDTFGFDANAMSQPYTVPPNGDRARIRLRLPHRSG